MLAKKVFILGAPKKLSREALNGISFIEFFIWEMDTQFVNNNARLPLTVVCVQNESKNMHLTNSLKVLLFETSN